MNNLYFYSIVNFDENRINHSITWRRYQPNFDQNRFLVSQSTNEIYKKNETFTLGEVT